MTGMVWNDIAPFIQSVSLQVANEIGQAIVERAKELVPVDTGALQASITYRIEQSGGEIHIIVGAYMPYAGFVELGTSRAPAQPYLRPSVDALAGQIAEKFVAAFSVAGSPSYGSVG